MDGITALVLGLIVAVFLGNVTTLTVDNTHLKLSRIEEMSKKCDNNGGLDYIEHDYDVVCKNGAEFSSDRSKVDKE